MRNINTYDQWLNEQNGPTMKVNPITVGKTFMMDGKKVSIIGVTKRNGNGSIVDFIAQVEGGKQVKGHYEDGSDSYVLDEFEGSVGPTTMPLATMLLATQTAANGVAF
jgi:hypothetical protein